MINRLWRPQIVNPRVLPLQNQRTVRFTFHPRGPRYAYNAASGIDYTLIVNPPAVGGPFYAAIPKLALSPASITQHNRRLTRSGYTRTPIANPFVASVLARPVARWLTFSRATIQQQSLRVPHSKLRVPARIGLTAFSGSVTVIAPSSRLARRARPFFSGPSIIAITGIQGGTLVKYVDATLRAFSPASIEQRNRGLVSTLGAPLYLAQPLAYTYTHSSAPDASNPDASLNLLNNYKYGLGSILSAGYTGPWDYCDPSASTTTYSTTTYSITNPDSDGKVAWQSANPGMVQICDLASAITPRFIRIFGLVHVAANVHAPTGFKIRAADNSGISVNVATVVADFTTMNDPNHNNTGWLAYFDVSSATAKQYWEITAHRQGQWLWITDVEFWV